MLLPLELGRVDGEPGVAEAVCPWAGRTCQSEGEAGPKENGAEGRREKDRVSVGVI